MNVILKSVVLTATFAVLALAGTAQAQDYVPDIVELDGTTGLVFESSPQLSMTAGGTIEFWVSPDWTENPGYDPVIVCNGGPDGASYLIAMLAARDGLAVVAGEEEAIFAFDFTSGNLHHIALSHIDDGMVLMIDGRIAGTADFRIPELPSYGLWVGSINGEDNRFEGAIAGLRLWNSVVTQEELIDFALQDVFDGDHPNIENLAAMSDFANEKLLIVEAIVSDDPQP